MALQCHGSISHGQAILGFLYAAAGLGYAGLDHYSLAPMSAHSAAMNITIICGVIAASLLMIAVVWSALRRKPADRGFRNYLR